MMRKDRKAEEIVNKAISVVTYTLKYQHPQMTYDGFGNGELELMFPPKGDPFTRTRCIPKTERDQDGFPKTVSPPTKPNIENLRYTMEMVAFNIRQYVAGREDISGKLIFTIKDGKYEKYESETVIKFHEIKDKMNELIDIY